MSTSPPRVITLPRDLRMDLGPNRGQVRRFVLMAESAGLEIRRSWRLRQLAWSTFQFKLDGLLGCYDFSDFLTISFRSPKFPVFRKQYTSAFFPFRELRPFGQSMEAAIDDSEVAERAFDAGRDRILYAHTLYEGEQTLRARDLRRRRNIASAVLADSGGPCDSGTFPHTRMLELADACLAAVVVPGSWPNCVDRLHMEYFAMGVPVITPRLISYQCGRLPVAGVHYIPVDDAEHLSDLADAVAWTRANLEAAHRIGQAGQAFYLATSTPKKRFEFMHSELLDFHSGSPTPPFERWPSSPDGVPDDA